MNNATIRAGVNPKKKLGTTVLIAVYAVLTLFSAAMGIFDVVSERTLFGILFIIAAVIFLALMFLKGNAAFGTCLKFKDGTLYMKSWDNHFLPYDPSGSSFFSDLKPAKTKVTEIPADDIISIFIGTKDYVKRNITEAGKPFLKALYPYERSSKKSKQNMVSGIDLIYLETRSGECAFMSICDYSIEKTVGVINEIYNKNPAVEIKVSNRECKKYIMQLREN